MKAFTQKKQVAGVTLQVPIYTDEATTNALIQQVNDRIEEIASTADRIDTQAFALLAALSFAADLHNQQTQHEQQQSNQLRALKKLTESLRSLLRDFNLPT